MPRNIVRQALAALLVVLVAATPVWGAVCTMSCSEGGGQCCCESPGSAGTLQLAAASCCGPETSSPAAAHLHAERLPVASPAIFFSGAAADLSRDTGGPPEVWRAFAAPARGSAQGRSSPLFLLNVSLLI